jgi:hypothetical protein
MFNTLNLVSTIQMSDLTALETMTEYENQKKMLESLQSRLEEAEQQILDGEKLRKKLHNTILVRTLELPKLQYIYVIYLFLKLFLSRS